MQVRALKNCGVIFLMVIIGSCKAFKTNKLPDTDYNVFAEELIHKSNNKVRPENLLIDNASLKIEDSNGTLVRSRIYVKRDEYIFISARYLGFELMRIKITEDSVKYINRVQQSYFFGLNDDILDGIFEELFRLKEIQDFLYTGFLNDNPINRKYIRANYRLVEDKIRTEKILDTGLKLELEYNLNAYLEKIFLTDHKSGNYLQMTLQRNSKQVENISGIYYDGRNAIPWFLNIRDIRYESYNKTSFNIGKNYNKLDSIL